MQKQIEKFASEFNNKPICIALSGHLLRWRHCCLPVGGLATRVVITPYVLDTADAAQL